MGLAPRKAPARLKLSNAHGQHCNRHPLPGDDSGGADHSQQHRHASRHRLIHQGGGEWRGRAAAISTLSLIYPQSARNRSGIGLWFYDPVGGNTDITGVTFYTVNSSAFSKFFIYNAAGATQGKSTKQGLEPALLAAGDQTTNRGRLHPRRNHVPAHAARVARRK